MTTQSISSPENPWQLQGFEAQLQIGPLSSKIILQNPSAGIRDIVWNRAAQSGKVLGISLAKNSANQALTIGRGFETFARGSDLVARYPETQAQPFSLEVYWRVAVADSTCVQIDVIMSLQTSLLECYPAIETTTSLEAQEAWYIPTNSSAARQLSMEEILSSDEPAGVMLRSQDGTWSYLEMTYPEDLGTWKASSSGTHRWNLQRTLGGDFQEKGVIRRLRVRSVFFSQENDLEIAPSMLIEFADSPPPLTT